MPVVYTIGHGHHDPTTFLALLRRHRIDTVVDVRPRPRAAYAPWAGRADLARRLEGAGLTYLYHGDALGGLSGDGCFYDDEGHLRHERVGDVAPFREALLEVDAIARGGRVALLGTPEDPAEAPRRRVAGRELRDRGFELRHIRGRGDWEGEAAVEARQETEGEQLGLFAPRSPAARGPVPTAG